MTVHDTIHVGGVSEACKYNDHSECRAPSCGCDCHRPPANPEIPKVVAGPEKACPKCGTRRPFVEVFCRMDGERLASLLCGVCGSGMNPEDNYCYSCGGPKGAVGTGKPKKVVTVPAIEVEVGYEEQVLRGLQGELNVQPSDEVDGNKRVVEQPMGEQGSFKIVSAPNPNKLRAPASSGERAPVSTQSNRGGKLPLKLPVKPA